MAVWMRAERTGPMLVSPLTKRETVFRLTSARRATSFIVGAGDLLSLTLPDPRPAVRGDIENVKITSESRRAEVLAPVVWRLLISL